MTGYLQRSAAAFSLASHAAGILSARPGGCFDNSGMFHLLQEWKQSCRYCAGSSAASASGGDVAAPKQQLHAFVEPLADEHEGISVISLQRPEARNAIGRQLLRELGECLDMLRQERSTRCVIVRSTTPGVFCAGADLKERRLMTALETAEFVANLRRTFTSLQELPMPTIAAIDGLALGGGAELALACDLRIASEDAALAFPETQLGIIPGAGGTQRLPRLVGASVAKELIFTGRRVPGPEAAKLGLVNHAVASGQAYTKALQLAAEMTQAGPIALRMAKAAMAQGIDMSLHSGLLVEEARYAQLLHTKDRLEGLAAFEEKRKPRYTGE